MSSISRRTFLTQGSLALISLTLPGCLTHDGPLVTIANIPKRFTRRSGHLTANICGILDSQVGTADFRLNKRKWTPIVQISPRVSPPFFTVELSPSHLTPGENTLEIQAKARRRDPEVTTLTFVYDPTPIQLPVTQSWEYPEWDVQDGIWETVRREDQNRVRPMPGYEGYDRIINITGAFPGSRRVETDITFRNALKDKLFGFGILPLWGGHADDNTTRPRMGWIYGIAWYYSRYKGAGVEFAHKQGEGGIDWVHSYKKFDLKQDTTYRLIAECLREPRGFRMRLNIHEAGYDEDKWIEASDFEGFPLPGDEFAVALVAHRCQAEFGPVTVKGIA